MASKNQTSDADLEVKQDQREPDSQELIEVGELCKRHKISLAVFAGVRAANGWTKGKVLTSKEFLAAVEKFLKEPIDPRISNGKKGESNA
jgi:hypothetical protein